MIEWFYTRTFSNKRLVWYGNEGSYDENLSFKGHLQQLTAEEGQTLGMTWTNSFKIWCPLNTDVEEGDILTEGGTDYKIRAIKRLEVGNNKHLELYAEK